MILSRLSGGASILGNHSVPGRSTNADNSRPRTYSAYMMMMSLSLTTRQPNGSFASKRFYLLTSKNT